MGSQYLNECGYGSKGSSCCPGDPYTYYTVAVTCRCSQCSYSLSFTLSGPNGHTSSGGPLTYCSNAPVVYYGKTCKLHRNVARDGCMFFSVLGGTKYTINGRSFSASKNNLDWTWC